MNLPTQAEPIERAVTNEKPVEVEGIEPQMDCYCLGDPSYWYCLIGRSLWNSGQTCTP